MGFRSAIFVVIVSIEALCLSEKETLVSNEEVKVARCKGAQVKQSWAFPVPQSEPRSPYLY